MYEDRSWPARYGNCWRPWTCVFVATAGITLNLHVRKFTKRYGNALFFLVFTRYLFKIKFLQKRKILCFCCVFSMYLTFFIDFSKKMKMLCFCCVFFYRIFSKNISPLFERFDFEKTQQKPSFYIFFAQIWFKKSGADLSQKVILFFCCWKDHKTIAFQCISTPKIRGKTTHFLFSMSGFKCFHCLTLWSSNFLIFSKKLWFKNK